MELRKLNEEGLRRFSASLRDLRLDIPTEEVFRPDDTRYTAVVPGGAEVEPRLFGSKLDFARYIHGVTTGKVGDRALRETGGIWAWLCLYYLDQVCPKKAEGGRRILSLEKYIATGAHVAYGPDKHLLYFPWKLYQIHGENAAWLLGGELREDTKVLRELANSYRRNVSPPFIRLAKLLYYDTSRGKFKRGATTSTEAPGSLRRLDRVMKQLDMTYDVFGMSETELLCILPQSEFGRWIRSASGNSDLVLV